MSLSSNQLDAFFEVAKTKNFSRAARNLSLTQPAFSQRILNLEKVLGVSLLIREPAGVRLTDAGIRLLRYCQTKSELEKETVEAISRRNINGGLGGEIRIGGYSSVFRSAVIPALTDLVGANPLIRIETFVRETRELPDLLRSCEIEFMLLDRAIDRQGVQSHLLGHENYVLVGAKAKVGNSRKGVYLDHDQEDRITELFFKKQGTAVQQLARSFMDDIYGIIDGVEAGWGRAVLPLHLVRDNPRLKVIPTKKKMKVPVFLHYHIQPFYTDLHEAVVSTLVANFKHCL